MICLVPDGGAPGPQSQRWGQLCGETLARPPSYMAGKTRTGLVCVLPSLLKQYVIFDLKVHVNYKIKKKEKRRSLVCAEPTN